MSGGNGDGQHGPDELTIRYNAAMHRMQSAVAWQIQQNAGIDVGSKVGNYLKHLRTGLNSAMAEHGALAKLLIEKGVISDQEYRVALAEAAEREAELNVRKAGAPPGVDFA